MCTVNNSFFGWLLFSFAPIRLDLTLLWQVLLINKQNITNICLFTYHLVVILWVLSLTIFSDMLFSFASSDFGPYGILDGLRQNKKKYMCIYFPIFRERAWKTFCQPNAKSKVSFFFHMIFTSISWDYSTGKRTAATQLTQGTGSSPCFFFASLESVFSWTTRAIRCNICTVQL